MEEIYFDKEGRDKLILGINKANDAVASTMGPMGSTVIIPDNEMYGKYKVTKDGVSVINSISFKDPVENIGVELLREAANQTVKQAGDGTTTSTVLTTAFVNNLKDFDSLEINKAFDRIIPEVIEQLKKNSKELKKEDIFQVASISANNDNHIGNIIQDAYNHSDTVKIETWDNDEDKLELVEGMSLPVSYFSKYFVNDKKKGECNFINPHVLILDGKLDSLAPFEAPIQEIAKLNESLLIITEDVHLSVLKLIETNVLNGYADICVIKAPGFAKHRKDLLRDLSDFTGATIIDNFKNKYTSNILGKLKSCKISKMNSVLVKHDDINIDEFISNLKEFSKSDELTDYDKELVNQRIEKLTGKVSIIKVGGRTPNEMKERKDRYDDAVLAVACALEEGIVSGAGVALRTVMLNLVSIYISEIEGKILDSLYKPYIQITENGSQQYLNFELFDLNIIDPLKVTRCALENAVSVAKVILGTKAIVLNKDSWN